LLFEAGRAHFPLCVIEEVEDCGSMTHVLMGNCTLGDVPDPSMHMLFEGEFQSKSKRLFTGRCWIDDGLFGTKRS